MKQCEYSDVQVYNTVHTFRLVAMGIVMVVQFIFKGHTVFTETVEESREHIYPRSLWGMAGY